MAVTAESDIDNALNTHLKNMAGAWPIAWKSVALTPPANGRYYRVDHQPNSVFTPGLGQGGYIYRGLYLVSVVVKEGEGEMVAKREASRIVRRFDYLTTLTNPSGDLIIDQLPSARGALVEKPNCEVPVVIQYQLTTD